MPSIGMFVLTDRGNKSSENLRLTERATALPNQTYFPSGQKSRFMDLKSGTWTHETAYCVAGCMYGIHTLDRQRVASVCSNTPRCSALRRAPRVAWFGAAPGRSRPEREFGFSRSY